MSRIIPSRAAVPQTIDRLTMVGGLIGWTRPGTHRLVWPAHLPGALTAAIFLGAIRFWPASWNWFSVCLWSKWTGLACPFCGLTRSLTALAHGDWGAGLAQAPLSGVLVALAGLALIWHGAGLMLGLQLTLGPRLKANSSSLPGILILLVLANWCYRLALGLS